MKIGTNLNNETVTQNQSVKKQRPATKLKHMFNTIHPCYGDVSILFCLVALYLIDL